MKYPIVFKSVKISDETHKKLQSIGKVKETFDDVIKRLLDNYSKEKDSLMRVLKIPGKRNIEINLLNKRMTGLIRIMIYLLKKYLVWMKPNGEIMS